MHFEWFSMTAMAPSSRGNHHSDGFKYSQPIRVAPCHGTSLSTARISFRGGFSVVGSTVAVVLDRNDRKVTRWYSSSSGPSHSAGASLGSLRACSTFPAGVSIQSQLWKVSNNSNPLVRLSSGRPSDFLY
jgi:hypothetical protein